MGRTPRIEFAGAIYHVMNRGDHHESIYEDDQDREIFLKTLEETCVSCGWVTHGFVLMKNHYHLLIETGRPTLVKGMQNLNSTYTRRYNVRHKTFGHLFQGRYKALLVEVEAKGYFLAVSDYIHMNPVRSKRISEVKDLLKDPWSSAGWLAGSRKARPEWLRWERVYGEFGLKSWTGRSRREYREYLERRIDEVSGQEELWKKIRRGWCLGSEGFVGKMKEMLREMSEETRERDSWAGAAVEEMEEDLAMEILKKGYEALGYHRVTDMKGTDRYLLALWIRKYSKVGLKWLAQQLKMDSVGTLSHGIWKIKQQLPTNDRLSKQWKKLKH